MIPTGLGKVNSTCPILAIIDESFVAALAIQVSILNDKEGHLVRI
jgi:hypothetical protein